MAGEMTLEPHVRRRLETSSGGQWAGEIWNLMADAADGPNHVGHNCDADIICDPQNSIRLRTARGAGLVQLDVSL